jgi:hypothetical protein
VIYFLTRRPSEEYVWDYVKRLGDGGPKAGVLCYEDILDQDEAPFGLYVFTGLNRFGPRLTRALALLYESLSHCTGLPPLNHPAEALRRYELLRALHREGLNEFDARGAWEDLSDLRYPVFVRDRSLHGSLPSILRSRREVEVEVGWALVRGADLSELIVVEFLNTLTGDGLFRKYSAYVVGESVIPVSLERGKRWVLRHPEAEFDFEALEEEKEFVLSDPHAPQLQEVRKVARIGFGRMDYSVLDGRVQVWEINTLPTMRRPPGTAPMADELRAFRQTKREVFRARFLEAWHALCTDMPTGPPVELGLPQDAVRLALEELASEVPDPFPNPERYGILKTLLRPVKNIAMPLASKTFMPFFARWMMKRSMQAHARARAT